MKVHVKGGGSITLTQRDYLGQGGEGTVYVKGSEAYKVYHDPSRMIPLSKIQDLSGITDPNVIKPTQVLTDAKGTAIGYTMRYVNNTRALCQIVTPAYRKRENLDAKQMLALVQRLQAGIQDVHDANVLVVDMNEMNFLISSGHNEVYFIDVDSYQTPRYPATAIMESIRDWTVKGHDFTTLSDWYSFAILSFQMFVGVHPFKGKYKGSESKYKTKLPTDAPDDAFAVTRRRMQDGISVLRSDVGVPGVCYPFDVIPSAYMEWYKALFNEGKRVPPPTDIHGSFVAVPVKVKAAPVSHGLNFTEIHSFPSGILGVWYAYGTFVVSTQDGLWLDGRRVGEPTTVRGVGFTPQRNKTVCASLDGNRVVLYNASDKQPVSFGVAASEIMSYGGCIYLKNKDKILEVVLTDAGGQVVGTTKPIANVLEHATSLFEGVAVQDMLGSTFVSLFPRAGSHYQVRVKELDGYKVLDARYDGGVLMVQATRKGSKRLSFDSFVFRFDQQGYSTYDVRKADGSSNVQFITLDSGVCLSLTDDDRLEVFSARPGSTAMKVVEDSGLSGALLAKKDGQALSYAGSKVYKMSMR